MDLSHRILIVDDDRSVREALEVFIRYNLSEAYALSFASSGEDALEEAAAFMPDLVLLDVMMPGMDGFEVCRRLRADPLLAEVPVLLITGLGDHKSRLEGLEAGADDFITKPFDGTELEARIHTILRLNRYRRLLSERSQREEAEATLAKRVTQLTLLNKIGGNIAAVLELDTVLAEIVRLAVGFGFPHLSLFILESEPAQLALRASAGTQTPHFQPGFRLGLGQGLAGWVARNRRKRLISDLSGEPPGFDPLPEEAEIRAELAVPLRVGDEIIGVLDVQSLQPNAFDANDVLVLESLADQIAAAIHNAQLYAAEREARARLRALAGHLESARERERAYIAREIHDEFGQALTALKMDLTWLARRLPVAETQLLDKAAAMEQLIDATIDMVRRIATDLRPGVLDHLGLVAAIEWQAQELSRRAGFECELLLGDDEPTLDPDLVTALFRIFQETLTNIARHAEATRVQVTLAETPANLVLVVRDNGRGISRDEISDPKSLGLLGMQERARSWGGDVTFEATPGSGTTVFVQVPHARDKVAKE